MGTAWLNGFDRSTHHLALDSCQCFRPLCFPLQLFLLLLDFPVNPKQAHGVKNNHLEIMAYSLFLDTFFGTLVSETLAT